MLFLTGYIFILLNPHNYLVGPKICNLQHVSVFPLLDCRLKTLCLCCTKPIIFSNFLLIFIKQRSRACNYFNNWVQTNTAVQTKKDTAERDPSATRLCCSAVVDSVILALTSDSNGGEVVSGDVNIAQKFKSFKIQPFIRLVPCVKATSKTTDMFGKGRKESLILIKGPFPPKSRWIFSYSKRGVVLPSSSKFLCLMH